MDRNLVTFGKLFESDDTAGDMNAGYVSYQLLGCLFEHPELRYVGAGAVGLHLIRFGAESKNCDISGFVENRFDWETSSWTMCTSELFWFLCALQKGSKDGR